jgi:hypothetical protein
MGRKHLEVLGIEGTMKLKCTLKNQNRVVWTSFKWLRTEDAKGCWLQTFVFYERPGNSWRTISSSRRTVFLEANQFSFWTPDKNFNICWKPIIFTTWVYNADAMAIIWTNWGFHSTRPPTTQIKKPHRGLPASNDSSLDNERVHTRWMRSVQVVHAAATGLCRAFRYIQ